jgi:hypothetical protein
VVRRGFVLEDKIWFVGIVVASVVTLMVGWRVSGGSFRLRRFGIVVWVWSVMEVTDADEVGPCKDKVNGAQWEMIRSIHAVANEWSRVETLMYFETLTYFALLGLFFCYR